MKIELDPDAPLCSSGKRPFKTEELALRSLAAARFVRRTGDRPRLPGCVEQGVFECGVCGWWHLTSATGKRRRGELANRGRRQRR